MAKQNSWPNDRRVRFRKPEPKKAPAKKAAAKKTAKSKEG